jgi:PAS domain S-box-containing protein
MTLSGFLSRLIWLCVLPLVLLAVWLAVDSVRTRQAQIDEEATSLAGDFATAIDQRLKARIAALNVLAGSPLLDDAARWPELYRQAQAFQANFGSHVVFADSGMRMLFNTRVPFGTPLPTLPEPAGFAAAPAALETGKPAVGDIVFGPIAGQRLVAVAVPVRRGGEPLYLLLATFEASDFAQRLALLSLPAGWSISMFDGQGVPIATRPSGRRAVEGDPGAGRRYQAGSALSRWSVRVEIPPGIYRAPLYQAAAGLSAAILGATLVGVLGGTLASRSLGRSVASLADTPTPHASFPDIVELEEVRRRLAEAAKRRHSAEADSRESEARFIATFEQAAVGIAMVAPDGRWLRVNHRLCAIVGYTQDELSRLNFQDITHPDDLEADLDQVRRMLAREIDTYAMEKRYIRKDGGAVWIMLTVSLVWKPDRTPDYFIAVVEDIQARKLAEEQLRLWAQAFTKAHFGLAIADARSNTFLAANPAFAAERGYRPEEMVGMPIMAVYPEGVRADVGRRIAEVDATLHGVFESEHIARDGRRFPVMMDITVTCSADGGPLTRIAYSLDITARKRDEARLREQAAMLRDISARLMRVQEEERRALAHELHDEIGQQLAALKLNLQTMARTVPGQAAAARIQDCIEIVEIAIEQVRDRALNLRPSMLDDLGLAAALDWYCRRQSERSGTEISLELEAQTQALPDPIPITAFRIVQEAVNNAIRYAQARHIEVTLRTLEDSVELVVQDDGRGFDPAALDPRRDDSLGLLGMRQRVDWLGGELDITSTPGSGTLVRATLPLTETAA